MLLQPFVNFNLPHGWYLTSSPIMTANWEAGSGDKWTVPVGGGVGKLFKLGKLPINTSLQAYYNAERPGTPRTAAPLPGPVPAPDLPVAYDTAT